jgi:hypothetical protein
MHIYKCEATTKIEIEKHILLTFMNEIAKHFDHKKYPLYCLSCQPIILSYTYRYSIFLVILQDALAFTQSVL